MYAGYEPPSKVAAAIKRWLDDGIIPRLDQMPQAPSLHDHIPGIAHGALKMALADPAGRFTHVVDVDRLQNNDHPVCITEPTEAVLILNRATRSPHCDCDRFLSELHELTPGGGFRLNAVALLVGKNTDGNPAAQVTIICQQKQACFTMLSITLDGEVYVHTNTWTLQPGMCMPQLYGTAPSAARYDLVFQGQEITGRNFGFPRTETFVPEMVGKIGEYLSTWAQLSHPRHECAR